MPRDPRIPGGTKRPANGAGYGGPAKGAGNRAAGPGRPAGVANGEGKRAKFAEILAPRTPELAERWLEIANDTQHPHQHTMILKAAELAGEFKAQVDVTSGGARIGYVIAAPPMAEDAHAWMEQHKPR